MARAKDATPESASEQVKNRGQFKPGKSGNPGGRPKTDKQILELFKSKVPAAIERVTQWLDSRDQKASLTAASIILERALGKTNIGWGKGGSLEGGQAEPLKVEFKRGNEPARLRVIKSDDKKNGTSGDS